MSDTLHLRLVEDVRPEDVVRTVQGDLVVWGVEHVGGTVFVFFRGPHEDLELRRGRAVHLVRREAPDAHGDALDAHLRDCRRCREEWGEVPVQARARRRAMRLHLASGHAPATVPVEPGAYAVSVTVCADCEPTRRRRTA